MLIFLKCNIICVLISLKIEIGERIVEQPHWEFENQKKIILNQRIVD